MTSRARLERLKVARQFGGLNWKVFTLLPVLMLALQVALPAWASIFRLLDLPLLAVAYLALTSRSVLGGILLGVLVGLTQDGLTHGPLGLFGIVKTVVGYAAASVSLYIEVDYPGARSVLTGLFYLLHQALFWFLETGLIGVESHFDPARTLILAAIHSGLAVIVYRVWDRTRSGH